MASNAQHQRTWIISPLVDLSCISVGWLVFFVLPVFSEHVETTRTVAFTFFVAHRYFTFPLVYLDRPEFERRKWTYLVAPVVCLVGVWLCYVFRVDEPEMFAFWWFFNYFHFVRQKYGILRIYSGKSRWGHKRLDELVTYGWGGAGILYMLAFQSDVEGRLMHYLAAEPLWLYAIVILVAAWWVVDELGAADGKTQTRKLVLTLGAVFVAAGMGLSGIATQPSMAQTVTWFVYVVFGAATVAWLVYEFRSPNGPCWPKVLFVGSVTVMYGVGPTVSPDAVLIATSFSHAAEYIAIVALTVKNKGSEGANATAPLVRASRHVVAHTVGFMVAVTLALQGLKALSMPAFLVFTYGTSFMHFIYDGMIWKLRRPRVARDVGAVGAGA